MKTPHLDLHSDENSLIIQNFHCIFVTFFVIRQYPDQAPARILRVFQGEVTLKWALTFPGW